MRPVSDICASGRHCPTCRDREGARPWRTALGQAFELPPGAPDFECPLGRPWGYASAGAPVPPATHSAMNGHAADAMAAAVVDQTTQQARRDICDDCPEHVSREYDLLACRLIQHGAPCAYTRAVEQGQCPLDRWPALQPAVEHQ